MAFGSGLCPALRRRPPLRSSGALGSPQRSTGSPSRRNSRRRAPRRRGRQQGQYRERFLAGLTASEETAKPPSRATSVPQRLPEEFYAAPVIPAPSPRAMAATPRTSFNIVTWGNSRPHPVGCPEPMPGAGRVLVPDRVPGGGIDRSNFSSRSCRHLPAGRPQARPPRAGRSERPVQSARPQRPRESPRGTFPGTQG